MENDSSASFFILSETSLAFAFASHQGRLQLQCIVHKSTKAKERPFSQRVVHIDQVPWEQSTRYPLLPDYEYEGN